MVAGVLQWFGGHPGFVLKAAHSKPCTGSAAPLPLLLLSSLQLTHGSNVSEGGGDIKMVNGHLLGV